MTQTIDRSRYRRLLNQAFEEGKELQRLEDIIFKVRQLASIKRAKVKELEAQAEELERTRLMNYSKQVRKTTLTKSDILTEAEVQEILTAEEIKKLGVFLKGGKNDQPK